MFEAILDHPAIIVTLDTGFDRSMPAQHAHCFNSMPIDEYFDGAFGPLPCRSIRFHHDDRGVAPTINFTDTGPITRETDRAPAAPSRA